MKKVLSIVLSLVLVICMMPVMAFAATSNAAYSDISGEKCEGAVNVLTALGVVDGYEDGSYKPEKTVTRAEMAKLIITALGMDSYATATTSSYSDMALAQWAIPVVEYATNLGIIEGVGGGRFSPGNPVTYEQAATMIVRALGYTTDCNEMNGTWPAIYVQKATALGLFKDVAGSNYGTGANRGDVAIMLYNALDVPQVYADKDGETHNKRGEYDSETGNYSMITMMTTLNKNGNAEYGVVSSEDIEGAAANVRSYLGAAAKITTDKNGDVIAIGDVKTTFLTGTFTDNTFTADDTEYICYPKYKTFAKSALGTIKNADSAVKIENGKTDGTRTLAYADGENKNTMYTIAATVEGKTITGIFSIATWDPANDAKVTDANVTQITKNKKLLGSDFEKNNNGEIDTNSFILNGVDSLSDIKADNVVAVYTNGKTITKVEVGTEVVSGEITRKYTDKITVDGKDYKFSGLEHAAIDSESDIFTAGNEVELTLDYNGKIYDAELVNGMAGNYAVVIDKTEATAAADGKIATGLDAKSLKMKMIFANGDVKTIEANASKLNDNGVTANAWNNLTSKALVTYQLDSSDQLVNIKAVTDTETVTAKVSSAGNYDGYAISDNAAIFRLPDAGDDLTKDSNYSVVSKSALAGTSNVNAIYKLNKDKTQIAAMAIISSSDSTKLYGILNGSYTNADSDTVVNGFIGNDALTDAVLGSGTFKADTLFEITKSGNGEYDLVKEITGNLLKNTADASVSVKSNALYDTAGVRVGAFGASPVVYVWNDKTEIYEIGAVSDINAADEDATITYYMTEDDPDKDDYNLITYVVIK